MKGKKYTKQFIAKAMGEVDKGEETVRDIARRLKMPAGTLHGWMQKRKKGIGIFATIGSDSGNGSSSLGRVQPARRTHFKVQLPESATPNDLVQMIFDLTLENARLRREQG